MIRSIYLAGGCFWGTAHLFSLVPGVTDAVAGYANSIVDNPTYQQVCTGKTEAAETVKVDYDPDSVSLGQLIDLYLQSVDPTSLNRQGNDRGTQYRTGIYYTDPADAPLIESTMKLLDKSLGGRLAIEYGPLRNFYPAEEYHQDYLDKNPGGYCHVNPSLFAKARELRINLSSRRFVRPDDETLRQRLTPLQWEVTQNAATERPYVNEYDISLAPASMSTSPAASRFLYRPTSMTRGAAGRLSPGPYRPTWYRNTPTHPTA